MSFFLGTTSGTNGVGIQCCANDTRNLAQWFDDDRVREVAFDEMFNFSGFSSPWWPGGSGMDSSGNEMFGNLGYNGNGGYDMPEVTNGTNSRFGIVGVTRDVYGSPLTGAVVKLFLTNTPTGSQIALADNKIDQVNSDANGAYFVSTPFYPDQHYLVVYKAGSPDVFGSSVNTLIAS